MPRLKITKSHVHTSVLEIDPLKIITFDTEHVINYTYHEKVKYGPYIDQRTQPLEQINHYQQMIQQQQEQITLLIQILEGMNAKH
jgi:hypothetical protein